MKKIIWFLMLIILLFAYTTVGSVFAQDNKDEWFYLPSSTINQLKKAFCIVTHGEGAGFTLIRHGKDLYYDLSEIDIAGMSFFENDIIITEMGTFIEIQMIDSTNMLKVFENTSVEVISHNPEIGSVFTLSSGKVQAKIDSGTFKLNGKNATVITQNANFGYDIYADQTLSQNDLISQIYCFGGSVAVEKTVDTSNTEKPELVILRKDKIVVIKDSNINAAITPNILTEEFSPYWSANDFRNNLSTVFSVKEYFNELDAKRLREKNINSTISILFLAVGTVLIGNSIYSGASDYLPHIIVGSIFATTGIGGLTSISIKY